MFLINIIIYYIYEFEILLTNLFNSYFDVKTESGTEEKFILKF